MHWFGRRVTKYGVNSYGIEERFIPYFAIGKIGALEVAAGILCEDVGIKSDIPVNDE